jgi:phospholipase/lecithinase/hemolysin
MTLDSTVQGQCVQSDNALVSNFNTAVRSLVDELNGNYPQAKFVQANSYDLVSQIISNPAGFGNSNTKILDSVLNDFAQFQESSSNLADLLI